MPSFMVFLEDDGENLARGSNPVVRQLLSFLAVFFLVLVVGFVVAFVLNVLEKNITLETRLEKQRTTHGI